MDSLEASRLCCSDYKSRLVSRAVTLVLFLNVLLMNLAAFLWTASRVSISF